MEQDEIYSEDPWIDRHTSESEHVLPPRGEPTQEDSDIPGLQSIHSDSLIYHSTERDNTTITTDPMVDTMTSLRTEKKAGHRNKSQAHINRSSTRKKVSQSQDVKESLGSMSLEPSIMKTMIKIGSKPSFDKETFVRWLASLPETFKAPLPEDRQAKAIKISQRARKQHPTVESQRIGHFLSSLPEEPAEYESASRVSSISVIDGLDPPKRSQTSSTFYRQSIERSLSQEEFPTLSHLLTEETDNDQFSGVTKSILVHYASDDALNLALATSKQSFREATDELKAFAATNIIRTPSGPEKTTSEEPDAFSPMNLTSSGIHISAKTDAGVEPRHPRPRVQASDVASTVPQDVASAVSQNLTSAISQNLTPTVPQNVASTISQNITSTVPQNVASTVSQNVASAESRPARAPGTPSLASYLKGVPKKPRRRWESATVIMERVLDDNISKAPTSLMSANTRATISQSRSLLRWNDRAYGYLPVFVANGKVGGVRALLSAGCNPGTVKKPRWTPIYNAIRGATHNHTKCLQELISHGANVNAVNQMNGRRPLHYAIEKPPWSGYSSVIYTLLAGKADPNAIDEANNVPLLMLLAGDGPLPQEKRDALYLLLAPNFSTDLNVSITGTLDNPLHLAIRRKDAYTVDAILEKMKQVQEDALELIHKHNGSGFTPLLLAFTLFNLRGEKAEEELQIIKLLLENGADPNVQDHTHGGTPLHLVVCGSKNTIALELLCKHSADAHLRNKVEQSAIDVAHKLRFENPKDKWYPFAKRRMSNTLKDRHYRPSELLSFINEEAGVEDKDNNDEKEADASTSRKSRPAKANSVPEPPRSGGGMSASTITNPI